MTCSSAARNAPSPFNSFGFLYFLSVSEIQPISFLGTLLWTEGGDTVPGSVGSAELADWLPAGQEIILICVKKEFDHMETLEHLCRGLLPVPKDVFLGFINETVSS